LEEWSLRKKRREEERDIKMRKRRAEARARAHEQASSRQGDAKEPSGPEGGDSGPKMEDFMNSMPGLEKMMSDPEIMEMFSDPGNSRQDYLSCLKIILLALVS